MLILMHVIFIVMLALGIPLAICLGMAGLVLIFIQGFPATVLIQQLYLAQESFLLMAVPLFILAGELMIPAGVMEQVLRFINVLVGRFRGGLGYVVVSGSMIFAGTSGSAVADASAIGSVMIPLVVQEYKDRGFAASITSAASTIGPIIPPSIPMIFYALIANVSVIGLFLSGVVPGIIMGVGLIIMGYFFSVRRKFPVIHVQTTFREFFILFFKSIPVLFMVVFIVGGMVGGVFTPTEAAAMAVLYVMLIGMVVTRKLKPHHLPPALIRTGIVTGVVFFILSTCAVVAFEYTIMSVPEIVAAWFLSITSSAWVFLLFANIFLLLIGTILEPIPAMIMVVPILEPVALKYGIHPIHFGFVVVLNLVLGMISPPVGSCLFVCGSIANISLERMSRDILPWFACLIFVLLLVTYIPPLVLWLPKIMGYE